ncbi:MAG: hypothetical protein JJ863_05530 [Deltaproteobacteria bacterium]|nr:hypothetical protein [Deltaproteobacteria bacterium]
MNIKEALDEVMKLDGATGAAIVDYGSGMCLGTIGNPGFDLELAAAANTEVVRSKKKARDQLGLKDRIVDILVTLDTQYHLIRMVGTQFFIYVVLDVAKSNLALSRIKLKGVESQLELG